MGFARHTADLVALVADGGIPECSTAPEFFDQPEHETTRRFLQRILKY
jgi:ABC-type polar amino acid transport system ATPase subunit